MRHKLKIYYHIAIIAIGIYLFINIEVILWHILEPDGFWGLVWFYSASTTLLLILTLSLNVATAAVMTLKSRRLGCLGVIGLVLLNLLGLIIYHGPLMILPKYLSDKYKYIKQSEKYISEGKYEDALKYAVKIYDKVNGREVVSPILIFQYLYENSDAGEQRQRLKEYEATINYAYCLQETGVNLEEAEILFNNSIKNINNFFNSDPELLIFPQTSLTKIYLARGDNQKAERSFTKSINLISSLKGDDVYYSVLALFNYAFYNVSHGDYKRAMELNKQALNIYNKSEKSKESYLYLIILLQVADDYLKVGDIHASKDILSIANEFIGDFEDNVIFVDYLKTKSHLLEEEAKVAPKCDSVNNDLKTRFLDWYYDVDPCKQELIIQTEETLFEIIDEIKDRQGERHKDYASALYSLGTFYYRIGDYNSAISNLSKALEILHEFKGYYNFEYYSILFGIALSELNTGNISGYIDKVEKVESYLFNYVNESFPFFTEEEKETYIMHINDRFRLINSAYRHINDTKSNDKIFNNILSMKNIANQSNQFFKESIQSSKDSNLMLDYTNLLIQKEKIINAKLSGSINANILSVYQDSIRVFEKNLLDRMNNNPNYQGFKINGIKWHDVQTSLGKNEVIIEFFDAPISPNSEDSILYSALLIDSLSIYPLRIDLSYEKDINRILSTKVAVTVAINKIYSKESDTNLYNLVWKPLEEYVKGYDKIYLSLSGVLHRISFTALLPEINSELIILSSSRKLVENKRKNESFENNKKAVLYGGIDYGHYEIDTSSSIIDKETRLAMGINRSGFTLLPYTKIEVDNIAFLLRQNNYTAISHTGLLATEESFKRLQINQPQILHIATHGFYFPPQQSYRANKLFAGDYSNTNDIKSNPLLRTGLLFSNANKYNDKRDDGILTALEISKMDLSNVDMVVLSACETGLGDILGGEGVYGLQRSFKNAGVNTIIMSLWRVDDEKTAILMEKFYEYYLPGLSKRKSLHKAQQFIKHNDPDPYSWGAFVIVE